MGNEQSSVKELDKSSYNNIGIKIHQGEISTIQERRRTDTQGQVFSPRIKVKFPANDKIKDYYPYKFVNNMDNNENEVKLVSKFKKSNFSTNLNDFKLLNIAVDMTNQISQLLSRTNNLDIISSAYILTNTTGDNLTEEKNVKEIEKIIENSFTISKCNNDVNNNCNINQMKSIRSSVMKIYEMEEKVKTFYKEMDKMESELLMEKTVSQSNASAGIESVASSERNLKRNLDSKSPKNDTNTINLNKNIRDKSNSKNTTMRKKTIIPQPQENKQKVKNIKLDLRFAGKKMKSLSPPQKSQLNSTQLEHSNTIIQNNLNSSILSKAKSRSPDTKKVQYHHTSKSPTPSHSPKTKTIIYKPSLDSKRMKESFILNKNTAGERIITKGSCISNREKSPQNTKNNIEAKSSNNNSNWQANKITYAELMKKKNEEPGVKQTSVFTKKVSKSPPQNNKEMSKIKKELSSSLIEKNKSNNESGSISGNNSIKNININIKELNIIKKEKKSEHEMSNHIKNTTKTNTDKPQPQNNIPSTSKLDKLKNLKVHLNFNQLQSQYQKPHNNVTRTLDNTEDDLLVQEKIHPNTSNSNSSHRSNTPMFHHIHKRSNSFGTFNLNTNYEFNPDPENLNKDSASGEKFSFRNPIISDDYLKKEKEFSPEKDNDLMKHIQPRIIKSKIDKSNHSLDNLSENQSDRQSEENESVQTDNSTTKSGKNKPLQLHYK